MMQYKTVLVHEQAQCCGNGTKLEDVIQKSLDEHSRSGWVLIIAYQQVVPVCGGKTVSYNARFCAKVEMGAVLVFGKKL